MPRRFEDLAVCVFRITTDAEQPTLAAQPIFLVREQQGEDPKEHGATDAATAMFRYRDVQASTRIPGRHAPQLLDAVVFGGGTVGVVTGPAVTLRWAGASAPDGVTGGACALEVVAIVVGMLLYRFRRR